MLMLIYEFGMNWFDEMRDMFNKYVFKRMVFFLIDFFFKENEDFF